MGHGAHPASYHIGTRCLAGVKQQGHGVNHPPPCNTEVKGRVEVYFYSPSLPSWQVIG